MPDLTPPRISPTVNGNGQKPTVPGPGRKFTQQFWGTSVAGNVQRLLGNFNPRYVSVDTFMLMRNDPCVAFGLAIRRAPIINMQYTVESDDPKIAAFVEAVLQKTYRQMAVGSSLAIPYGFQLSEKVWKAGPFKAEIVDKVQGTSETLSLPMAWTLEKVKAIDPRTINLLVDKDEDEWIGAEQSSSQNKNFAKVKIGREKALLWSYRAEEVWGYLHGYPLLNQTYEPWWWKVALNLFANQYFERRANPPYKAITMQALQDDKGNPVDGFEFMNSRLIELKNGDAITLPSERDEKGNLLYDVSFLADDKRGDMFQGRLDALDTQILRGMWITDKAGTSDGSGSLAMAEVHADTLSQSLESDLKEWGAVVNEQIVNPLVLYNFGQQAVEDSDTKLTFSGLSQSMRQLLKEILVNLLSQGPASDGGPSLAERMDGPAIAASLGVPLISAEEIEEMMGKKQARQDEQAGADGEDIDDEDVADDLTKRGALDKGDE